MKLRNRMLSALLAGALVASGMPAGLGAVTANAADASFAGEEWYDQIDTVEVNREPAHAYFTPYETAEQALANEKSALDDKDGSIYRMSLNGDWKFKFAQKPADREKDVKGANTASYVEDWDTSGWDTIKVPSSIQAQKNEDGTFKYEKPIYSNQRYPWQNYESVPLGENVVAPTVNNSVGHYKRTFTIPSDWDGRDVFVHFEGVESAFYLYVNGQQVGYAEDSYTSDEFNITSYLRTGENTIAVEVYRWSTGSYLENQDFIRYSGIFRDVNLYSKNQVEVRDVFIKTELDDAYKDATLELDASIRNLGDAAAAGKTYQVKADLYEIDGKTKVWDSPLEIAVNVPQAKATVEEKSDDVGVTVTGSKAVKNPKKWFADTPNLYLLLIELKDDTGYVVETLCQRVGFREIGKVDINENGQEQAQINGKKIMFRGTNRHESDHIDGRAITKEDIKEDLFLMKEFNVNAIRMSHYPNNPYTYALADELGLYICDETNVESHIGASSNHIPSGYPVWNNSVMDRTKNMVERDKNHPSVVIWSLGNEATYQVYEKNENYCFWNSTQWILQRDPSRLRKYERDNRYTKGNREDSIVDIYSSQYWGVSSVEGHVSNPANKAPYIQSEYAHAMGNGLGNFKEYWDVFRNYPNGQGGFIWDWIDQSLLTKADDSDEMFFGYGGDWGETVHDRDFCANGLVNADRTPSPELYEVKKVHQEVSFYDDGAAANGQVRVVNEFLNTNLNKYNVSWTLKEDDKLIGSGSLTEEQKNIAPLAEKTVTLSQFPAVNAVKGSDYVLTMSVTLKENQVWAGEYGGKAGEEIAFEQFELSYDDAAPQPVLDADKMLVPQVNETADTVTVTGKTAVTGGKDFEVVVDKATGYITSYKVGGKTLLENGPVPDYYRAPVSNDPGFSAAMRDAADNFTVEENGITVNKQAKSVSIHVPGMISGIDSEQIIDYVVYGDGRIVVTNTFTPSNQVTDIAKIGMKMTVAQDYEKLTYYGYGPQENYTDRNTGAKLAVYESTVTDQFESKYVKPQDNANRTGVRWTALRAEDGTGILVSAADQMEASALHYKSEDLANSQYKHPYQVPVQDNTILSVALVSRGLGNASCGPGPLGQYLISSGTTYSQTFSISPITQRTQNEELMARSNVNVESGNPLSGIKVNGAELVSFAPGKTDYTYEYLTNTLPNGMIPKVEPVKMSNSVKTIVTQAEKVPGDATIYALSPFGIEQTYTIHIVEKGQIYASDMDWEVDQGGYFQNTRDHCGCGAAVSVYVNGAVQTYEKGIGAHAPAEVGIKLDGVRADRFTAQAGISACQSPGAASNVNFVVKGDGKEIFRKNDVLAGESYPVELNIKGIKRLSLIVETNGADSNDHALWADAKISAVPKVPATSLTVTVPNTTIQVGEKMQAKATVLPENTYELISWASSNPRVATVSENGVITAVAAGEVNITAATQDGSNVKGSAYIKVVAKPAPVNPPSDKPDVPVVQPPVATPLSAPASVKATSKAAGVTVSFAKVDNAASYDIYRKSGSSAAKKIANVTKASYVDTKAPGGKKSTYTVVAVSGSASYTNSAASAGASVTLPKAVTNLKAKAVKGGVKISFKAVKGAKEYTIYRATKKNGTYKKLKAIKKTSYTDKKAKKGKNYYKVVVKKGKTYSPASKIVSARVKKK